jgi:hypothetical protein
LPKKTHKKIKPSKSLKTKLNLASRWLGCRTQELFEFAFTRDERNTGKDGRPRRGVLREAREAAENFIRGRYVARKAMRLVLDFIANIVAPPKVAATA